jgi:DNA-binding protein HU-beta
MNKAELVAKVAEKSGVSQKDSEKVVNAFIESVKDAMKDGEKVQLIGFGTFEVGVRAPHESRNPRTGEKVKVGEKKVPKFKFGNSIKELLNS